MRGFFIADELGSFWEVDGCKDDFSEEEKTLKKAFFNRFLLVFLPQTAIFDYFSGAKTA